MTLIGYILLFVSAALTGVVGAWFFLKRTAVDESASMKKTAAEILAKAKKESKELFENAELEVRRETLDRRNKEEQEIEKIEAEMVAQELDLTSLEERLGVWETDLESWSADIKKRMNDVSSLNGQVKKMETDTGELEKRSGEVVEEIAGEKAADVRERIRSGLVDAHKADCADRLRNIEASVMPESSRSAKRILGISIGRLADLPVPPRSVSGMALSKEEVERLEKHGQIVFQEIENAMGAHVAFDAVDGLIRVECVDGVTRELGRRVLHGLVREKRGVISKEAVVVTISAAKKEMNRQIRKMGLDAFKTMKLEPAADEIVELLGRLFFRTSYAQNQYHHALEASMLAGLMAHELGVDVTTARRAGLLHDIGKALTHEIEGSHAVIGAQIAERNGESPVIVNAIAAHHDDEEPGGVFAYIVAAADAASGARPGARRELVEAYMDRIQELERAARSFAGVSEAYAVQAGRELRVLVDEKKTNDEQASALAADIAGKISEEMVFPGQIKVTVIRSTNAVAVAG